MTETFPWPEDGLESVSKCPVCDATQREIMHRDLTDRLFCVAPGLWTLYRCAQCQSAYLDPRPNAESIGLAYTRYFTHQAEDHPIVRRRGVVRSLLHDMLNDYRNACYGLNRAPSNFLGRWLVPLFPSLRAAVDAQCRHLPHPPNGGGKLLDVGFGNGGFLQLATEMGWNAEGIDFDPDAVEVARSRGLNVRCISADTFDSVEEQYDVITICHVIEHVHHPASLLRNLFSLLKPGGMLWLDTPNLDSAGYMRFGRNWRDLDPPRHLVLFSTQAMKNILKNCGFSDVKRHWRGLSVFDTFPVSEALECGSDPTKASRQGKPPLREVFAELHEMLTPLRRDFITLTARKPVRS